MSKPVLRPSFALGGLAAVLAAPVGLRIGKEGKTGDARVDRIARARDEQDLDVLAKALPPFEDWSNLAARATKLTSDKAIGVLKFMMLLPQDTSASLDRGAL